MPSNSRLSFTSRSYEARAERDPLLGRPRGHLQRAGRRGARAQEISPHYAVHTEPDANGYTVVRLTPTGSDPDGRAAIGFTSRMRFAARDEQEAQR
ncbi:hypothetical protein [Streptomyces mangrovisoli]|uniref:hypothetical protein n=1 Tax=Streptomyces mangrovisoli TaxID=1428628 RepID=UPI000AB48C61|nr:hypothetical protein [Streptomyces mangrovisoli]